MVNPDFLEELKKHFDNIYVSKTDCTSTTNEIQKEISISKKDLAVINTKINAVLYGLGAVFTAVIGVLVKILFNT